MFVFLFEVRFWFAFSNEVTLMRGGKVLQSLHLISYLRSLAHIGSAATSIPNHCAIKVLLVRMEGNAVYSGQWKNGGPNGKGVKTWSDGDVCDGEFAENKQHGRGTMKCANGDVYDGEFADEKMHGRGMYKFASGDVYDGEIAYDKMHGRGMCKFIRDARSWDVSVGQRCRVRR